MKQEKKHIKNLEKIQKMSDTKISKKKKRIIIHKFYNKYCWCKNLGEAFLTN